MGLVISLLALAGMIIMARGAERGQLLPVALLIVLLVAGLYYHEKKSHE